MPILGNGGHYLKADAVKTGETLVFKNGGEWIESQYTYPPLKQDGTPHSKAGQKKSDLVFKVAVGGHEFDFRMNATNQNILKEKFGRNTDDWVNKMCKIDVIKVSIAGKVKDSILLTPIETPAGNNGAATPEDIAWEE